MRYAYPCQITRFADDEFVVSFPDVTGAVTGGTSRAEALKLAEDALAGALGMYVELREPIPVPSPVMDGQEVVAVDPTTAAKLELYSAMRHGGVTKRALAKRLGLSETTVGRLVDPNRRTRIDRVATALQAVGRGLVVEGRTSPR